MTSTNKHSTDPIGARNLDSESNRPKLQDGTLTSDGTSTTEKMKTLVVSDHKDIPSENRSDNVKSSSKTMSFLIDTVRPNLFVTEVRLNKKSTFVPSSRALFYAYEEIHSRFTRIRGYHEYENICTPPVVKLALAISFYYRVLKVMSQQGLTNHDMEECISTIERSFPGTRFIIPEPFIPFYQAICAFQPKDDRFGEVSPILPTKPCSQVGTTGVLDAPYIALLPNMTSLFTQAQKITDATAKPTDVKSYTSDISSYSATKSVDAICTDASLNKWKRIDIGSQEVPRTNYSNPRTLHNVILANGLYTDIPKPFADINAKADSDVNTWLTYLKLDKSTAWIGTVLEALDVFCIPFSGNCSLQDMPLVNGSYNAIIHDYGVLQTFNDKTAHLAEKAKRLTLECASTLHEPFQTLQSESSETRLSQLEIEISALTQLNVKLPKNYIDEGDKVGVFGGTLSGPFFDPKHSTTYGNLRIFNSEDLLRSTVQNNLAAVRLDRRS